MQVPLAFIGSLGYGEMMVVGLIALLLFGKRLPEVARSLGKSVTEFKKGIRGIEEGMDEGTPQQHQEIPRSTETQAPRAPKFEPPTSPPTEVRDASAPTPPGAGSAGSAEASQLDSLSEADRHRDQPVV